MFVTDITRDHVPAKPGVYLFKTKGGKILYIWKAKHLRKRLKQYFAPGTLWKQDMVAKAGYVEFFEVASEQESLLLEISMINTHKPPYNNLIKGDTAYVYIKIAQEPFPNIQLTRYKYNDKALYIGPKIRRRELKELLQMLRYVFQRRQCGTAQFREGHVCSDYFFGLCQGRCAYSSLSHATSPVNQDAHTIHTGKNVQNQNVWFRPVYAWVDDAAKAYKDIITYIKRFFEGDSAGLLDYIRQEIETASKQEYFEWAAKLRDMYFKIELLTERQDIVLPALYTGTFGMIERVQDDFMVVLLKLREGRIIDIIAHLDEGEYDYEELLLQLEREYGVRVIENENQTIELTSAKSVLLRRASNDKQRLRKEDKETLLQHASTFAYSYIQSHTRSSWETVGYLLERLQQRYQLQLQPNRIECLDISHFSGDYTAGGLVAMEFGQLAKSRYKRYKITTGHKHDDYAALAEVLVRRCGLGQSEFAQDLPDMFILDGGMQQLGLVHRVLLEFPGGNELFGKMQFASLGKWKARKRAGKVKGEQEVLRVLKPSGEMTPHELQYDDADRVLVRLRDEAHRFANNYRKKLMEAEWKEKPKAKTMKKVA